jgi:hypothetical protein
MNRMMSLPVFVKNLTIVPWPFKDYDYIGNITTTPTECLICIEAENEMFTKYAHPKAHSEAHKDANTIAEKMAIKTEDYIEHYTFYYRKEYIRIYKECIKKYKDKYYTILLEKGGKMCNHHLECLECIECLELKSRIRSRSSSPFKYY